MLTSPVAAARAAVATGAWVKSKHDMYLIRGSVGAQALFFPIRRRIREKKKEDRVISYLLLLSATHSLQVTMKTNLLAELKHQALN